MKAYLLVGLGSALGGMLRHAVSEYFEFRVHGWFPWGIWSVNVTGSFLIGLLFYLTEGEGLWPWSPEWRILVLTGILGGYTTFSTFSLQVLLLTRSVGVLEGICYVAASIVVCLIAAALGAGLAHWVHSQGVL